MQQSFTIGRLLVYCLLLITGVSLTNPAAAQGYTDNGQRYIMYNLYHYGDADGGTQRRQIRGMEDAFSKGFNSVVIGIAWDIVQPSLNSTPNWADIDRFVEVAQRYNAKIAIRIKTCRRDRVGFWPEEQSMQDTRGKTMDQEGQTHFRLGYTPAIDKAQDFARLVAQRYKYLNDRGDLLFMSLTFNPQWENEHWGTNYPDQYKTTYDFNELTIGDFQRWALAKYNGSLDAVNRAWGSNYAAASAIRPTYPNANNEFGFRGKRGADWYVFRHQQLKTFNDRFARTIKAVDPTIRIIIEQGSVHDTPNRGTLGFKNLAELFDGVKVNDSPGSIHQFSMDLLRSNVKPGGWIINEVDGMLFRDPSSTAALANQIETSFKYGAKIITFANYFLEFNQEDQLRQLLEGIRAKRLLEQPVPTLTPVGTITYKLSSIVQDNVYETGMFGQWNAMRGSDQKPVRILLNEDLLEAGNPVNPNQAPTVANRVPNQSAIINSAYSFKIPANTFTDADGQITGVTVSGLPVGLNYDKASGTITGTPGLIGASEVTVTATDNNNATVAEYFVLTVKRATLPLQLLDPILDCNTGRFEFRSTEGDGSPVEYLIEQVTGWNTQAVYTLADQFRAGSTLTLKARQSGTEQLLRYTTSCLPEVINKPPVVNGTVADQLVTVGKSISVPVPATLFSDPDGSIASVSVSGLPTGAAYSSATRSIDGTITTAGLWTVTITATDNKGATVSTTFKLTVEAISGTKPLRLLDPLLDCSTGRFEFRSADGDGTPVEYAADDLFSLNTRAVYTLADQSRYGARLTLRARQSGVDVQLIYTTRCTYVNKAPVVGVAIGDQQGVINKPVLVLIPASAFTDADGTIVSVSVSGLPPGLSYDPGTRFISGTVPTTGSWPITVVATDNQGATGSTTFILTIGRDVKPLRLLDPVLNCDTGLFEFRSADGDGSPIEYSIDRLVDWSTNTSFILAENMRRSGQLDIKARQSGQLVAGVYYPACPAPNQLPTVKTPIGAQVLTQFRNVSIVIPAGTFTDADGTIASISVSGLPAGLTHDPGTSLVSGAATQPGSWTVTVRATDNRGGTVSTTFVITVAAQVKPLRLLDPLVDCATGKLEFQTADGDGSAIGYSIDQLLNWSSQPVYTLAEGTRYSTVLTLRVRQSGTEQTLNYLTPCLRPAKPLVVTKPMADQVLIVNQPASVTLPANLFTDPAGGPISIALTGLPVGLSYEPVKGIIQGIPTLIGTSPAVARATGNPGLSVSDTFLITVRTAPRFAVTTTLLDLQGKLLKELVDGDLLDSRKMPVLANLSCQPKLTTGSVLMELTGKAKRTVYTNAAPYLLYPSGQGFKPEIGSYQVKISVFSGANGTGTLLGTTTVRFDIVIPNEGG